MCVTVNEVSSRLCKIFTLIIVRTYLLTGEMPQGAPPYEQHGNVPQVWVSVLTQNSLIEVCIWRENSPNEV